MSDRRGGSLVPPSGWLDDDPAGPHDVGALYLLVIGLVALALRLIRIDGMSIWVDEVFTWQLIAPHVTGDVGARILAAYQGPLYHALAWPLLQVADTPLMLRLPAALASAFTVPIVACLAARLWGRATGQLAGLLALLAPFAAWYAHEARGYSLVMLFASAAGLVMFGALRHGLTWSRAVALALLIAGGLMSNFSYVFLLVAFGLTVVVTAWPRNAGDWARWSLALGGGVLLAAPWLLEAAGIWEVARVVPGTETGDALRGDTTFNPWALPFAGYSLLYGFSLGPSLTELHRPDRLAVIAHHAPVIAGAALAALGPLLMSLTGLSRRRWLLLLWVVIPLVAVVLLAMRNVKPFNVRYLAVIWPWLVVLLAAGLTRLALWPRRVFGAALIGLSTAALLGFYLDRDYAKEDIGSAVAVLTARESVAEPVLAPTVGLVVRYYLRDDRPVHGCWGEPVVRTPADADGLVARQLVDHDQAWYLRARGWDLDPQRHLPDALRRAGRLTRFYTGPGVTLDRWTRDPRATEAMP